MPENRYFVDVFLQKSLTILLQKEEALHLIRVMRKKIGNTVELVNGKDQLAYAKVSSLGKSEAHLCIEDVITRPRSNKKLILAQGMTKPSNLDFILEKGTELGATDFWLFPAEKSEKKALSSQQLQRLAKITIAALKQCGRLDLPEIHEKKALKDWKPIQNAEIFFGDISKSAQALPKALHEPTAIIVIGSEGGFSPKEQEILRKKLQATPIRFNANILRAETAAVCALSLFASITFPYNY